MCTLAELISLKAGKKRHERELIVRLRLGVWIVCRLEGTHEEGWQLMNKKRWRAVHSAEHERTQHNGGTEQEKEVKKDEWISWSAVSVHRQDQRAKMEFFWTRSSRFVSFWKQDNSSIFRIYYHAAVFSYYKKYQFAKHFSQLRTVNDNLKSKQITRRRFHKPMHIAAQKCLTISTRKAVRNQLSALSNPSTTEPTLAPRGRA